MPATKFIVRRKHLELEAKAKIFWGEPPDSVMHYLHFEGISREDAEEIVGALVLERIAAIRGIGIKRICLGVALIVVPWIACLALIRGIDMIPARVIPLAYALGLCGVWKLLHGILVLVWPKTEKGDLGEESD